MSNIQLITTSFPESLKNDIAKVCLIHDDLLSANMRTSKSNRYPELIVQGSRINLISRVYSCPTPNYHQLSPIQQVIIDCIYSRHCNGYIRENHLKRIITQPYPWVLPFVIRPLGSYVKAIVDLIYSHRHDLNPIHTRHFLRENPEFFDLTQARVLSYWDAYYRRSVTREDYSGFKMIAFLTSL